MSTAPTSAKTRSPLAAVIFTIFVDLIGIGILIPVIPQLLANPDSPHYLLPAGWTINQGYFLLGLLTAIYPIMMFFAAPILGQLSDHYGRKKILSFCLSGTAVGYVIFAIAILTRNIPLLFASRILDGLTGGNISVAQAAIADVSTPQNRAKNFGLMGMAFGVGFVVGPFLGGVLADPSLVSWFSAAVPFWFAAILATVNAVTVYFFLPETNKNLRNEKLTWTKSITDIGKAFALKEMRVLFTVAFLFQGGFSFFVSFFAVFLTARFGYTEGDIGFYFAFLGVCIAITQGFITRAVANRGIKDYQVVRITLPLMSVFVLLFLLPREAWWLYVITPFFAINNGLTMANFMAILSHSADPKRQGEVMGISASVQSLSNALPPLLSGVFAAWFGIAMPTIIAVVFIAAGGLLFLWKFNPRQEHVPPQEQPLGFGH